MEENKALEDDNLGAVKISEDVVAIVADRAIREVSGIAGLSGGFASNIAAVLGKKNNTKGIDVELKEQNVTITLHAVVKYGVRIPEVAWQAQESVKKAVEDMTGLNVLKVNINIEGVEIKKESPPSEPQDEPEAQDEQANEETDEE